MNQRKLNQRGRKRLKQVRELGVLSVMKWGTNLVTVQGTNLLISLNKKKRSSRKKRAKKRVTMR